MNITGFYWVNCTTLNIKLCLSSSYEYGLHSFPDYFSQWCIPLNFPLIYLSSTGAVCLYVWAEQRTNTHTHTHTHTHTLHCIYTQSPGFRAGEADGVPRVCTHPQGGGRGRAEEGAGVFIVTMVANTNEADLTAHPQPVSSIQLTWAPCPALGHATPSGTACIPGMWRPSNEQRKAERRQAACLARKILIWLAWFGFIRAWWD